MSGTRIEKDSFGTIEVPQARLWGAQTERSRRFFRISGGTLAMSKSQSRRCPRSGTKVIISAKLQQLVCRTNNMNCRRAIFAAVVEGEAVG